MGNGLFATGKPSPMKFSHHGASVFVGRPFLCLLSVGHSCAQRRRQEHEHDVAGLDLHWLLSHMHALMHHLPPLLGRFTCPGGCRKVRLGAGLFPARSSPHGCEAVLACRCRSRAPDQTSSSRSGRVWRTSLGLLSLVAPSGRRTLAGAWETIVILVASQSRREPAQRCRLQWRAGLTLRQSRAFLDGPLQRVSVPSCGVGPTCRVPTALHCIAPLLLALAYQRNAYETYSPSGHLVDSCSHSGSCSIACSCERNP